MRLTRRKKRVLDAILRGDEPDNYWGNKLGWRPNVISQFKQAGHLGPKRLDALEALMIQEGVLSADDDQDSDAAVEEALAEVKRKLRFITKFLNDPDLSVDERASFAQQQLEGLLSRLSPDEQ